MFNAKTKLIMPAPQMTDAELETLGKNDLMQVDTSSQNDATKYLVGNYSQREPTPTPMRTPRQENSLMREAQNLLSLLNTQTPLIGGENAPLSNPDFSGLTPKTQAVHTPNIISTNFATPKPRTVD